MRLSFTHILSIVVLFAGTALLSVAQDSDAAKETVNVAGKWTISTQGHHGSGTQKQKMIIRQDGNKISGSIQGDQLQGNVDGHNISFNVSRNTHHGEMTLEYRGTVQGDSIKGTIQGPTGGGSWSAKRESE
jgi:hypothetical protein